MSAYQFYEGYPDFHRSPRIIYRSSEDKITVNALVMNLISLKMNC
ncbi:TPA: hypothetical protein ACF7BF_000610 [Streptococcus agalactiae]